MKTERKGATRPLRAKFACVVALAFGLAAATAAASGGPGAHAPIGVMGDHTHEAGEVMVSYRYMRMGMNGLRDNDEGISRSKVLQDFPVTPTKMDMEMHMVGAMYAPIDRLTLMLMIPYVILEMDHKTRMGTRFTTRSQGVGDVSLTALVDLWERHGHAIHANLGLSFPSGSITERDRTPLSPTQNVRLPYPMQIGSGTYDFLPGLTYRGHADALNWGAQARGEVRLNENHAGYRQGNAYLITSWAGYDFARWLGVSLRVEWSQQLNVRGREDSTNVNPNVVPTADPGRRAFQRLDVLAGLNFMLPEKMLGGVRFAVEAGLPAYQRLDGPGLETDWMLTVGAQYAF